MDPVKRGLAAYKKNTSAPENGLPPENPDPMPQVSKVSFPRFEIPVKTPDSLPPPAKPPESGLIKTVVPPQAPGKESKGDKSLRKVAKFLILLGQEEAAKVIRHLGLEETQELAKEIAGVKSIDPVEAQKILQEFGYLTAKQKQISGGAPLAKSILEKALGPEKAAALAKKALPDQGGRPFEFLADLGRDLLALVLREESVPVLSVIIPHLEPTAAADLIKILPQETRKQVILRLAKLERVSKDVLESVEAKIRDKVRDMGTPMETQSIDGKNRLTEILKLMGQDGTQILDVLAQQDPDGARMIRSNLYSPDLLEKIRPLDLQNWLREWEDLELAQAVLALSQELSNRLLDSVSPRRRIALEQEVVLLGVPSEPEKSEWNQDFRRRFQEAILSATLRMDHQEDYL